MSTEGRKRPDEPYKVKPGSMLIGLYGYRRERKKRCIQLRLDLHDFVPVRYAIIPHSLDITDEASIHRIYVLRITEMTGFGRVTCSYAWRRRTHLLNCDTAPTLDGDALVCTQE